MEDCFFCKIAKGEVKSKKIYENDNFFSIPDANQKIEGHSLVISKKHFENILDLPVDLGSDLLDCIKETSIKIMKENDSEGLNIVQNNFEVAGQVVKHIHFHLLPRKKDDKVPHVY
jgi:histidine triad (HIT) family protein